MWWAYDYQPTCYVHWIVSDDPFEIIVNSQDGLKIFFDYGNGSETFTFYRSGESINVTQSLNDGGNVNSRNFSMVRTSDNLDALLICN